MGIIEIHYGKNTIKYVEVLAPLIVSYKSMMKFKDAHKRIKESLQILGHVSPNHFLHIDIYSNQADILM